MRPDPPGISKDDTARILADLAVGDPNAARRLMPLVYEELRGIAEAHFRHQPQGHTLQPTALVHEAYLRLVSSQGSSFQDRSHFMAVAARAMRQILVDHARRKLADKRRPDGHRLTLSHDAFSADEGSEFDVLEIHEILDRLAEMDERKARLVEMRFFGGLTIEQTAEVMGLSRTTISEEWRFTRAWLLGQLDGTAA